jgi:hypothetical protein
VLARKLLDHADSQGSLSQVHISVKPESNYVDISNVMISSKSVVDSS